MKLAAIIVPTNQSRTATVPIVVSVTVGIAQAAVVVIAVIFAVPDTLFHAGAITAICSTLRIGIASRVDFPVLRVVVVIILVTRRVL